MTRSILNCILFLLTTKFCPTLLSSDGSENKYKVMCYDTTVSRDGPSSIAIYTNRCTHIIYVYGELNHQEQEIQFKDGWDGFDEKYGEQIVEYHKIGVKVGLSVVGLFGWNNDQFSHLVRDANRRSHSVNQAIEFLKAHHFDGLEIAWPYPVCWQRDCQQGKSDERDNFAKLMEELSKAFKPAGLFLSCFVDSRHDVIDKSYDVSIVSKYVDWLLVFGEEHAEERINKTVNLFPLYTQVGNYSMANTVDYLIKCDVDPLKIVVKIPTYGMLLPLRYASKTSLQVCSLSAKNEWNVHDDEWAGSNAVKSETRIAFNSIQLNRNIAHFVRERGLLGAMIHSPFDYDDPQNQCDGGKYPTLEAVHSILKHPRIVSASPHPQPNQSELHCTRNIIIGISVTIVVALICILGLIWYVNNY